MQCNGLKSCLSKLLSLVQKQLQKYKIRDESFPLQWQAVYRCMVFSLIVRKQDSDKDGSDLEVSGTKSSLNLCIPYSSIYFGLLSSNPNAAPAADTSNNRVSTLDMNPFAPPKSPQEFISTIISNPFRI